jgi:protocatechuate 3,4-dioxygenase beta subunit
MKPPAEHDDDKPVGRVLSRREILGLLGTASVTMMFGRGHLPGGLAQATSEPTQAATGVATAAATQSAAPLPACIVRPEQTEGPYFVDERLNRSDIREEPSTGVLRPGVPLRLQFRVAQISTNACMPLMGAYVDVWHCDGLGVYSDVQGGRGSSGSNGTKFLRGYQETDANGIAEFLTIYPGWYQGRTVHIHFKIRTNPDSNQGYDFTSQLYFDDKFSDQIFASQAPYNTRGRRGVLNNNDGVYRNGGDQLLVQVTKDENGVYVAPFDIGLQLA